MKRLLIIWMSIACVLSACTGAESPSPNASPSPSQTEEAPISHSESEPEPGSESEDATALLLSDQEAYDLLLSMYDDALEAMMWYLSDPGEDLQLDWGDPLDTTDNFRKVGRFGSITEMQAETERYFTRDFCEVMLYDHGFDDPYYSMYEEREDGLYRNIQMGGIGWPYAFTDDFTVSYQTEDLLVLLVKLEVIDYEKWEFFVLKKEAGDWKIGQWFNFSGYGKYARVVQSAASAMLCSVDWQGVDALPGRNLLAFYRYHYLQELDGDYNDATPYAVPAAQVLEQLQHHFAGLTMEKLLEVAEDPDSSEYDADSDSFVFRIAFDPAPALIISKEESGDRAVLDVMVIAKSDLASYWGALEVQGVEDELRLLSNAFTDITDGE